ncbi:ABC transporter ATP-binding protein/permease [Thomasclavelia sp.]
MVLQLLHISKFYKFGKQKQMVLNDLSINFPRSGLVAIVGKSGSGKSTLLNLIAGIEKPNSGKVVIDGHELNYSQIDKYQQSYISYVYQFYNLIESLTVYENLLLLPEIKGKTVSLNYLQTITERLKITSLLDCFPSELSGGQKQRVGLARAFLCNTPILLADEPTGALNKLLASEVMELLKFYAKKHLVIVISHNYQLITKYSKMIIDLDSHQNNYNFNQETRYHKYLYQQINSQLIKIKFYLKRQLLYQKKKILMMFCSQIFTISAFVLLLSGINGGWNYIQTCLKSDPIKEIIEVSKKDYNEMNFTDEQINKLKKDSLVTSLNYKLDFRSGIFKTVKEIQLESYQVYKSDYIEYLDGKFPSQNNQIMINQKTAQKLDLDINDKINFIIDEDTYHLSVSAIINDYVNNGTNIYFSDKFINSDLKDKIIDKSTLIIKSRHFKQLSKKYEQDYFIINFHQDYLDSYQTLFEMALMVVICFLIVSFIISLILISIILKMILIERKRDISLMLANGLPLNKVRKLFSQETSLIGGIIGFFGSVLAEILLRIVNMLNISDKLFNLPNLFVLPKFIISTYDIYLIMILVYIGACFVIGIFSSLQISKMNTSILLKED